MLVMGISCYYHDSALAVVDDDAIRFAIHEERLSRVKHDARFPVRAIGAALDALELDINDFDRIVFYEDPAVKLDRLWDQVIDYWPRSRHIFDEGIPKFVQHKLPVAAQLKKHLNYIGPVEHICAPPLARRLGVLHLAVRARRRRHPRRGRRVRDRGGASRRGQPADQDPGDPFPGFARAVLFGVHPVSRLRGQRGRIQGHGSRALWPPDLSRQAARPYPRSRRRRRVSPQPAVLRFLLAPAALRAGAGVASRHRPAPPERPNDRGILQPRRLGAAGAGDRDRPHHPAADARVRHQRFLFCRRGRAELHRQCPDDPRSRHPLAYPPGRGRCRRRARRGAAIDHARPRERAGAALPGQRLSRGELPGAGDQGDAVAEQRALPRVQRHRRDSWPTSSPPAGSSR